MGYSSSDLKHHRKPPLQLAKCMTIDLHAISVFHGGVPPMAMLSEKVVGEKLLECVRVAMGAPGGYWELGGSQGDGFGEPGAWFICV